MADVFCFLGAVSRCEGQFVYGQFIRSDGRVVGELAMPRSAFNITPPAATVIIARATMSDATPTDEFRFKFRAATLEEVKFLDRVEMAEAMNWIRGAQI